MGSIFNYFSVKIAMTPKCLFMFNDKKNIALHICFAEILIPDIFFSKLSQQIVKKAPPGLQLLT